MPDRLYCLMRRGAVCCAVLTLSACATKDQAHLKDAALAPLNDLNLVHAEIPPTLVAAQRQPYAMPVEPDCARLAQEIEGLDAVLGLDLDAPASDDRPSLIERGVGEVQKTAIGSVRRTTESLVPFRSWVRKLSGAERYSRKVTAAITAGTVRRAFLKGLRAGQACGA
ncbi:MAG: hypothetical protein RLY71_300 [Pseudomonadota bacterium]|jgi:hypothetical protein